jgi:hypothetical protein
LKRIGIVAVAAFAANATAVFPVASITTFRRAYHIVAENAPLCITARLAADVSVGSKARITALQ